MYDLQLSIIIVNYNVKYFLEQCLCSVEKAVLNIAAEVWVVDNASHDGSIEYLQPKFSFVKFIRNFENVGFAMANNLALQQCTGKYVLYLNPDTIVPEDCFEKCIAFLETHTDGGALGIRMIDGSGSFLPESKRAFPSPLTSFFKLSGLTSLFPRSKIFARYTLGYLDEHKNHEVDVLSGAFLMAGRQTLNEVNGFDETFFMYGEDVDLSFRLQKNGLKNYYFSDSSIVHFKGESTRKGSLNYVKMFYQAMSIFVQKHYTSGKARSFSFFIHVAIWFRAAVSAVFTFILKIGLPLLDTIIILSSLFWVNTIWVRYMRSGHNFGEELVIISLPGFTLVFLIAATLAGIYDNKYKPSKAFYAALAAIIAMLAVYSLLPEKYRFSRGVILFGGLTASLLVTLFRWILLKANIAGVEDETNREQKTLVIGSNEEYNNIMHLLNEAQLQERILGRVSVNNSKEESIGTIDQLGALIESLSVKEVILCEGTLTFKSIIRLVQKLPPGVSARFHAGKSTSIIGSNSKDTAGEALSAATIYNLSLPYYRRMKRLVDLAFSVFILVTFPIQLIIAGSKIINASLCVFIGTRTWIGYATADKALPVILKGILTTTGLNIRNNMVFDEQSLNKIDYWYAKEYQWLHDVKLVIKHWRRLGR